MKYLIIVFTLIQFISACSDKEQSRTDSSSSKTDEKPESSAETADTILDQVTSDIVRPALVEPIDSIGKILFKEVNSSKLHNPRLPFRYADMRNAYGLFCIDTSYGRDEHYEIFYKYDGKVFRTDNVDDFIKELVKIPKDSIINWYDQCTVTCQRYIDTSKIKQALRHHNLVTEKIMVCNCGP